MLPIRAMLPLTRLSTRLATRRTFSIMQRVRNIPQLIESEVFESMTVTKGAAKGDWPKAAKLAAKKVVVFLPAIGTILGWPLLAKKVLDGHM